MNAIVRLGHRLGHRLLSRALLLLCLGLPAPALASPLPLPAVMLAPPLEGKVNVNTASSEQLELLPGIGPTTAARILELVKKRPLTHPSQLMRVKGIGKKTYDRIREFVAVEGETTLRIASPTSDAA
ncbi:MAG: helix-hairpin-helix domain-containing protein [Nannocystaceae bacterium]|nr:helix-hairpin-helix domain-containing protein [Nannocystaceae bacterium]